MSGLWRNDAGVVAGADIGRALRGLDHGKRGRDPVFQAGKQRQDPLRKEENMNQPGRAFRPVGRTLAAFVLALMVGLVGMPVPNAGAVIDGTPDGDGHPYVGQMVIFSAGAWRRLCSGVLISPTVYLTAAHCTDRADDADIGAGKFAVSFDPVVPVAVSLPNLHFGTVHTNPLFDPLTFMNDAGVIVFDDAVAGIAPADLPTEGLLKDLALRGGLIGEEFTLVGYGQSVAGNNATRGTRRVASVEYQALERSWVTFEPSQCAGDSGGPYLFEGTDLISSIAAFGHKDTCDTPPRAATRLDIPEVRDFLDDFVTLP